MANNNASVMKVGNGRPCTISWVAFFELAKVNKVQLARDYLTDWASVHDGQYVSVY